MKINLFNKSSGSRYNRSVLVIISSRLGWNRSSYLLMSSFVAIVLLIVIVWWPLAKEYLSYYSPDYPFWFQFDWLLLGIFLFMTLLIMAGADIRKDLLIVLIGLFGGLVIESWGTQTNIWTYYTFERPPLWIIPAWPIASLSIDRIIRILNFHLPEISPSLLRFCYWVIFSGFFVLLIIFTRFTFNKSLTQMAIITCVLLIITPTNYRLAIITFVAGSCLGYFLELWGTTRACWTYYTHQTPPVFAVFAHGLAAVSFWRVSLFVKRFYRAFHLSRFFHSLRLRFFDDDFAI